jgi:crotonobetaine/carnitine-CoA ligase
VDLAVPVEAEDSVGTGWLGTPVPGKEVRLDGDELLVRGRPMFSGYWNHPSPFDADGWFRTGDLVASDESGRLRLVGRKKDMVRRAGENIAAAEVEAVLAQHPAVAAAAVVPEPDPLRGEEVKAYVQLLPHQDIDPAQLVAFVAERLASFKAPRYVEIVDAFPLTPSARVAKHLLVGNPSCTYDARAAVTA